MPKIPTNEEFDKRIKEVHGDKFKRMEERIPNQKNIKMWCERCQKEWYPRISHLFNGFGCPNCQKMKTNELDCKIQEIFNGNYVRIGEYDEFQGTSKQKIKMECKICGHIQLQRVSHIVEGHGCWNCMRQSLSDSQRMSKEEFITRSKTINGNNTYDYSLIPELKNQRQKVPLICRNHGLFYQCVGTHIYAKCGCPKCGESLGEKSVRIYLENNKIDYERSKAFSGCRHKKQLYFDFFIPKMNTCIEYDGEQHTSGMRVYRKRKFTEVEKNEMIISYIIRDKVKDEYCKNNNIRLLRISYKDYKNIDKILSDYFLSITSG